MRAWPNGSGPSRLYACSFRPVRMLDCCSEVGDEALEKHKSSLVLIQTAGVKEREAYRLI